MRETPYTCQCPKWGYLHFYGKFKSIDEIPDYCVNALNGATFISTLKIQTRIFISTSMCQCPKWGYLHFYSYLWEPA